MTRRILETWNNNNKDTHLKRFSAPDLSINSLLISRFSFDLFDCSFPLHVAARGSEPWNDNSSKNMREYIWVDGDSWRLDYLGRENNGSEEFWIGKSLKIASESKNGLVLLLGYASPHELHQKSIREWSQIQ